MESVLRTLVPAVSLALALAAPAATQKDKDSDRDGLSDFQEIHKYRTDPKSADSDGDGVRDGDWNERREYSYTVRSIVRVMGPCGLGDLDDDYQDARVLEETEDYVELEVVHYPLSTAGDEIEGTRDWRRGAAKLTEFVEPRVNTNWDAKMRRDLLAELSEAGIDVDRLTDVEVVQKVSRWFMDAYETYPMFNALHVQYRDGAVHAIPGRERNIDKGDASWSLAEQFERELLGREMYYHKTRGTCTSSAMALTTVLRAVGIPTRMILAIPVVDGSDPRQVDMVRHCLTNHAVRRTILRGVEPLESSFASHTFNEVYVGGRWRRLNYSRLGQTILDRGMFGMLTHVHTFNDLSEWGLQPTWGHWSATHRKTFTFNHNNPYATIGLSDRFGEHADLENPEVEDGALQHLTITKAYWFHGPERPQWIGENECAVDGSGHVLMHVEEDFDGVERFMDVYRSLDKDFVLKAKGQRDVRAEARRGFWSNEFYLQIDAPELAKMAEGVRYSLHAVNAGSAPEWKVKPGVTLTKGREGERPAPAVAPTEHARLTIVKVYWADSPDAADWIRKALPGGGHLMAHVDEWIDGQDGDQLKLFTKKVDRRFVLKADGRPPVEAEAAVGCFSSSDGKFREILISVSDHAKLARGVDYRLEPRNTADGYTWAVKAGVVIQRR